MVELACPGSLPPADFVNSFTFFLEVARQPN